MVLGSLCGAYLCDCMEDVRCVLPVLCVLLWSSCVLPSELCVFVFGVWHVLPFFLVVSMSRYV
jgi:hypothetical protein